MIVTPDMIEALRTLRLASRTGLGLDGAAREAFDTLDNQGAFAEIDITTGYEIFSDEDFQ
jgi:hypothetical protein